MRLEIDLLASASASAVVVVEEEEEEEEEEEQAQAQVGALPPEDQEVLVLLDGQLHVAVQRGALAVQHSAQHKVLLWFSLEHELLGYTELFVALHRPAFFSPLQLLSLQQSHQPVPAFPQQ
jgi:hypothetical protein